MLAGNLALPIGLLAVIFYGPAVSGLTKFKIFLKTNSAAAQCLKDAQTYGDTQLFGGYSVPTESYCVCMHNGRNNKDVCRVQAEMLYRAYVTDSNAEKPKNDNVAQSSQLIIVSGPDTNSVRLPCLSVKWDKTTNKLSFSTCGEGTYEGTLECRRQIYDGEKETDKKRNSHSVLYDGEISSASVSATIDFGTKPKPENAQATNIACTATAASSKHHFVFDSSIDKTKDPDQKSEDAKTSALSRVKGMLSKQNKASGKTEGDFVCDILKKAIAAAVKKVAADSVNLLKMAWFEYSDGDMM